MKKAFTLIFACLAIFAMTVTTMAEDMTEAITEEVTEAVTEVETLAVGELVEAEKDRNWILGVIENAAPEEVEKLEQAINDALLGIETEDFGDWDWAYKLVKDNAGDIATVLVGLGLIAMAILTVIKTKRDKKLTETLTASTNIAVDIANENADIINGYKEACENLAEAVELLMVETTEKDKTIAELVEKLESIVAQDLTEHEATTQAEMLLASVVYELISLSNIPQIKKDTLFSKFETAKKRIEEAGVNHAEE